eukprot:Tbor_TRINITY_DN3862_c0_g1::TRINITY_DN3862_c0_g1_i1::g.5675::m.5675/K15449/TYW1; tRNA wybutosine-synthesizing protein 1
MFVIAFTLFIGALVFLMFRPGVRKILSVALENNTTLSDEKIADVVPIPEAAAPLTPHENTEPLPAGATFPKRVLIAFASQRNTSRSLVHKLFSSLIGCRYNEKAIPNPTILDVQDVDLDNLHKQWDLVIFIVSTYTGGGPPESAVNFAEQFKDMANDHRFPRDHFAPITTQKKKSMHLEKLEAADNKMDVNASEFTDDAFDKPRSRRPGEDKANRMTKAAAGSEEEMSTRHPPQFAVFGLGDIEYGENFNKFAKDLDEWIRMLGGKTITPSVYSSEARLTSLFNIFTKSVIKFMDKKWMAKFDRMVASGELLTGEDLDNFSIATTCKPMGKTLEDAMDEAVVETDSSDPDLSDDDDGSEGQVETTEDIEDIVFNPDGTRKKGKLLYPRLESNLTKQGYTVLGSHSAVKLCRWTKSMLRGRGGCYKHTFYNISSFQCMEMTPSLACANKCVFCWRHHTNPVGKSFDWEYDTPEFLIENALESHRKMIKQMRGVPGVQPERFQEAMSVKHCALSLVGEPIMYPEINRYVGLLHKNRISTFMVTNAQWPDRIRDLAPVTQLYLSIDACTKEDLKRIDRPLFEDFWERCIGSIDALALKRQRTVFRLTLVNEYNISNVKGYASMVRKGLPDFIEVKGVTYCGSSDASSLTMKHVPFHEEVVKFSADLCEEIGEGEYEIACEHEHSCCMLIARKQFKINGIWHTWIDYEKFYELEATGRTDFTSLDYALPTPQWAVFNSNLKGFDPRETRFKRNKPISK